MDFLYLSLSLALPFFTIPHTRMLHHCILSHLRTNQHWFHHLTLFSYHSACHSPLLTHASRETYWPSMLELADLPPSTPFSHVHMNSFFAHARPRGGRGTSDWGLEPKEGVRRGCSAMKSTVPQRTMLDGQAERSGLHAARQNTWCSSPQARLESAQDRRLG